MNFYALEPEVAGELGEGTVMDNSVHPPRVSELHYRITDWLGDDLIESFPCYLASKALASAIESSSLTGAAFRQARITLSPEAEELLAGTNVPEFKWLAVTGSAGRDDFGLTDRGQLVVSDKALDLLRSHAIDNCEVTIHSND